MDGVDDVDAVDTMDTVDAVDTRDWVGRRPAFPGEGHHRPARSPATGSSLGV